MDLELAKRRDVGRAWDKENAVKNAVKQPLFVGALLLGLLGLGSAAGAGTIVAASCSRADVGSAVTAAADRDVVQVPAGTCSWTSTLTVTKGITLQGAGIGNTIILDDVSRTSPSTGQVIVLNVPAGTASPRLTGLTIRNGSVTVKNWNGVVVVGGGAKAFRIDHVKFSQLVAGSTVRTYGDTYGVIDHCVFDLAGSQGVVVFHDTWGGIGTGGDKSWADATYLGTDKAVYIEDNTFTNTTTFQTVDSMAGGRFVFRYNTVTGMYMGNHGTESSGRLRSGRSFEIYNNTFTHSSWFTGVYLRGGTGVIFNNTFTGYNAAITVLNFRSNGSYSPWGQCNGTNSYDGNQLSNGYPCIDQIGRGGGTLLSGSTPVPVAWPGQVLEPVYEWNNTLNGDNGRIGSDHPTYIQEGRDFFNDVPKPGYVPFVYPHPLAGSNPTSPGPSAPTNLTVTSP